MHWDTLIVRGINALNMRAIYAAMRPTSGDSQGQQRRGDFPGNY